MESGYSKLQLAEEEEEEEEEEEGGGVNKVQDHQYGNLETLEMDIVTADMANSGKNKCYNY